MNECHQVVSEMKERGLTVPDMYDPPPPPPPEPQPPKPVVTSISGMIQSSLV